jgi:1-acyl-sn-glycerol-3-phosphate acyltransferase
MPPATSHLPARTVFGIRVEQADQPTWLFAINKSWVAAISGWHSLEVRGDFPRSGPVLLVANHVDGLDPMIVAEAVTRVGRRSLTMFARSEFFDIPLVGWWLRHSGGIPIRRDEADLGAMRAAWEELRTGHVVATFPQATRAYGREGRFGQIKSGPAYLAAKTGATVVAAAVLGTHAPMFSRSRFEVRFGQPFVVPALSRRATQAEVDDRTRLIEQQMLALLPNAYKRDRLASA